MCIHMCIHTYTHICYIQLPQMVKDAGPLSVTPFYRHGMYVYVYVDMLYVHTYVCTYIYIYMYMCIQLQQMVKDTGPLSVTPLHRRDMYGYMYVDMYIYATYVCVYMYIHMYGCISSYSRWSRTLVRLLLTRHCMYVSRRIHLHIPVCMYVDISTYMYLVRSL